MSKLDRIDLSAVMERVDQNLGALVAPDAPPSAALDELERAGQLDAALRLVAHCLPPREAVWWACMCTRRTAPALLPAADAAALEAAEAWVRRGEDALRRAAYEHADAAGFRSAEAWAAVAAFWSGDSLGAATLPVIAPPPHLTPIAVAGAVGLAATRGEDFDLSSRQHAFLRSARDIGLGGAGRLPHETEADR